MFEFTDEDLKSNRNGFISARQRDWLRMTARGIRTWSRYNSLFAVAFLLLGMGFILSMFLQNEGTRAALFSSGTNLVMLAAVAFIVLVIVGLSLFLARRQASRFAAAQLQSAGGKILLDQQSGGESAVMSHYVYVGRKRFTFGEDMSPVFQAGGKYKVYYFQSGAQEIILSYERTDT